MSPQLNLHPRRDSMHRTLFLIPHEIGPLPVFGIGWALIALVLAFVGRIIFAQLQPTTAGRAGNQKQSTLSNSLRSESPIWIAAAFIIAVILPGVELKNAFGDPVGMAIRGYGVFLVLGVSSAVALAAYRTSRRGMNSDLVLSLAPWVFIGGIGGARLFYVIQYRDGFIGETMGQTIRNMLAFTEGGLVVYGAFIGGFLAFLIFTKFNHIPLLKFGDAIVPCIFLGVFFGRLGCLLNGCCYGGRCEPDWASIEFPPLSAVYREQLSSGELLGMNIDADSGKINSVAPGSVAADLGIQKGDVYEAADFDRRPFETASPDLPEEEVVPGWVMRVSGKTYILSPDKLPERALPVRAAQVISSISSLVLCLILCAISPLINRSGVLMFLGFAAYAVLRFVLEIVRVDEAGQFNTSLSISQWVSVCVFSCSMVGLAWIFLQPNDEQPPPQSIESVG